MATADRQAIAPRVDAASARTAKTEAEMSKKSCVSFVLLLLIVVASIAAGLYFSFHSRLVLYQKTADGTEIVIYQMASPAELCFDTLFVYRVNGGEWRNHYYGHEDTAWKDCDARVDDAHQSILIYRNGHPNIRFNWGSDVFERHSDKGFSVDSSPSDAFSSFGADIRREVLKAIEPMKM